MTTSTVSTVSTASLRGQAMTCSRAQRTATSTGSVAARATNDRRFRDVPDPTQVQILDFVSTDASVEQLYRGSDAVIIRFTGNTADSLTVFDALRPMPRASRAMSSPTA